MLLTNTSIVKGFPEICESGQRVTFEILNTFTAKIKRPDGKMVGISKCNESVSSSSYEKFVSFEFFPQMVGCYTLNIYDEQEIESKEFQASILCIDLSQERWHVDEINWGLEMEIHVTLELNQHQPICDEIAAVALLQPYKGFSRANSRRHDNHRITNGNSNINAIPLVRRLLPDRSAVFSFLPVSFGEYRISFRYKDHPLKDPSPVVNVINPDQLRLIHSFEGLSPYYMQLNYESNNHVSFIFELGYAPHRYLQAWIELPQESVIQEVEKMEPQNCKPQRQKLLLYGDHNDQPVGQLRGDFTPNRVGKHRLLACFGDFMFVNCPLSFYIFDVDKVQVVDHPNYSDDDKSNSNVLPNCISSGENISILCDLSEAGPGRLTVAVERNGTVLDEDEIPIEMYHEDYGRIRLQTDNIDTPGRYQFLLKFNGYDIPGKPPQFLVTSPSSLHQSNGPIEYSEPTVYQPEKSPSIDENPIRPTVTEIYNRDNNFNSNDQEYYYEDEVEDEKKEDENELSKQRTILEDMIPEPPPRRELENTTENFPNTQRNFETQVDQVIFNSKDDDEYYDEEVKNETYLPQKYYEQQHYIATVEDKPPEPSPRQSVTETVINPTLQEKENHYVTQKYNHQHKYVTELEEIPPEPSFRHGFTETTAEPILEVEADELLLPANADLIFRVHGKYSEVKRLIQCVEEQSGHSKEVPVTFVGDEGDGWTSWRIVESVNYERSKPAQYAVNVAGKEMLMLKRKEESDTNNNFVTSAQVPKEKFDLQPPTLSGDGLKRCIVGEDAVFVIEFPTDSVDDQEIDREGQLTVDVCGPRHSTAPCTLQPCQVDSYQHSVAYEVIYVPDEIGKYVISVLWCGHHLARSPFTVEATDPYKVDCKSHPNIFEEGIQVTLNRQVKIDFDYSRAGKVLLTSRIVRGSLKINTWSIPSEKRTNFLLECRTEGENEWELLCDGVDVVGSILVYCQSLPPENLNVIKPDRSNIEKNYRSKMLEESNVKHVEQNDIGNLQVVLKGHGAREAWLNEDTQFLLDTSGVEAGMYGPPTLTMTREENEEETMSVSCNLLGGGVYRCSYVPRHTGNYLLHIQWNRDNMSPIVVDGSPFPISVWNIDPSCGVQCRGDGLCYGLVGELITIEIDTSQAHDHQHSSSKFSHYSNNNSRSTALTSSDMISVSCTGSGARPIMCNLRRKSSTLYEAQLRPSHEGPHTLSVMYGNKHVPGSPFRPVYTSHQSLEFIRVYGPGLESGKTMSQAESHFIVDAKEAGMGKLAVHIRGPREAFRVNVQRVEGSDRMVRCEYRPTEPGEYQIWVCWNGVPVRIPATSGEENDNKDDNILKPHLVTLLPD